MYSKIIEIILEFSFLFLAPYFSINLLPHTNIGYAISNTKHSNNASFQSIKNVPNKINTAVTAVLITDGKVCVMISSKPLKSFVRVDNR